MIIAPSLPFYENVLGVLGFELIEDVPSTTNDGRPKRWVAVFLDIFGNRWDLLGPRP